MPFYPRGNPHTESMPFTASDGVLWLAYIEGLPPDPPRRLRLWSQAALPGRRLRFDCATVSRVTTDLPAGSPFLADARLRALLDDAQPVPPAAWVPSRRSGASTSREHPGIEWVTRAGEAGRAVLAGWSRRCRQELVPTASNTLHLVAEAILGRRRARP